MIPGIGNPLNRFEIVHFSSNKYFAGASTPSAVNAIRLTLLTEKFRIDTISVADGLMKSEELIPLTPPVFHILVALSDQERHGYGIMQDVAAQTGNALQLGPGTLYGCLKRMLAAGLVEESDERPDPEMDDQRRRYYRITPLGRRAVRAEAERLATAVSAARARRLFAGGRP
jgi:DNA-binding PadR family transcriptional regulator